MSDDWEDTPVSTNACSSSNDGDNGKSFSKGRGFTPFEPDQGGANGASDGGWGGGGGRGGGRGRGGGGRGRGGRGGGGFRSERSDKFGDDDNDGDRQERGGGHERGGRGGGRGRGGFDGGDRNRDRGDRGSGEGGEDGAPEVKREIYIPPEPSNDENEMFGSAIESGINFGQYDKISVKVSGENVPKPIDSFEKSGIRPYILENIKKSGYTKPTPIQKNSIPIIMEGRDLMGCAQTGSGKTAAFLLPIINQLLSEPTDLIVTSEGCCQPHVVIVTPTRELTIQIYLEARKFAHGSVIKTHMAYGGTAVRYQADNISRGCHILVATPGRMHDFVGRNRISFDSIRFIVLDEADRMLDMGFMGDIEKMMDHPSMVPAGERQTLMFSATFPGDIQQLAGRFLHNYLFVAVGIVGGACTDVEQTFHEVNKYKKKDKLREILRECDNLKDRVLVFVEEKRNADFLAAFLSSEQFPTTSIHGGRLQRERELALADFKSGKHFILVATAVAARGLDIKNVSIVINFDLPKTIDEYVHRIGRTGRVGNRGKAISFFDMDKDNQLSGDLVRILKQAEQEVPSFLASAECGSFSSDAFGGRDIRNTNGTSTMVSTTDGNEPDDDW